MTPPLKLLPGIRLIAGREYIYDADLLSDHLAINAKRDCPDDLSSFSDNALAHLNAQGIRIWNLSGGVDEDIVWRVQEERKRRGQDSTGRPLVESLMASRDLATTTGIALERTP